MIRHQNLGPVRNQNLRLWHPSVCQCLDFIYQIGDVQCHPVADNAGGMAVKYTCRQTMEMVLLLGAVDNNRSRQLCHEAFYQSDNLIYIDSGNGEFSGQVVCGVRAKGRTIFRPVGEVYPEMLKAADKFPTELSCAEAAQADPQSIAANITAATAVVNMVYNILTHGENLVREINFSTKTVRMQTILEKHRRNAA